MLHVYRRNEHSRTACLSGAAYSLVTVGVKLLSAEVDMIPENTVEPDEAQQTTLLKMIDKLEELDDVQNVYHNAVITIGDDEEE